MENKTLSGIAIGIGIVIVLSIVFSLILSPIDARDNPLIIQSGNGGSSSSPITLLCQQELSSNNATLKCGQFTAKEYLQITGVIFSNGVNLTNIGIRFNDDISTNYASRFSLNGASDNTAVSDTSCRPLTTMPLIMVDDRLTYSIFFHNSASDRKIGHGDISYGAESNSGTSPNRIEFVCKWSNTSNQITSVTITSATITNTIVNQNLGSTQDSTFTSSVKHASSEKITSTGATIGKSVNSISMYLKKTNTPTGTATVCVMDNSVICKYTFGTIDLTTLTTSYLQYSFTNLGSTYTIVTNDRIGIKAGTQTGANSASVAVSTTNVYDSTNSIGSSASNLDVWADDNNYDWGTSSNPWTLGISSSGILGDNSEIVIMGYD